ncbi:MAG: divergent polysaccharide deacetylase family protein, partial [Alphaproteobacteria bacterium]
GETVKTAPPAGIPDPEPMADARPPETAAAKTADAAKVPDPATETPQAADTRSGTKDDTKKPGTAAMAAPPAEKQAARTTPQPLEKRRARPDIPIMPKALPRVVPDDPLPPAPDPALVQSTAIGPLPRIADDGRRPMDVYAKPFNRADKRPRIGIVVTGLGLSDAATESAIQGLADGVTLAFAPYSSKLNEWIRLARAGGHEVLINIPMEPVNYPAYDPGPQTLLTSLNANGNLDRLFWALSRATGYVGVIDFLGSRFTASRKHMQPVLSALNQRGLLYLDSGSTTRSIAPALASELKMSFAASTLTLDERASRKNIDRKFGELEQRARRDKQAIGIASPYPVTLERIANWTRQLRARGFVLAPVSALTRNNASGNPVAKTP